MLLKLQIDGGKTGGEKGSGDEGGDEKEDDDGNGIMLYLHR